MVIITPRCRFCRDLVRAFLFSFEPIEVVVIPKSLSGILQSSMAGLRLQWRVLCSSHGSVVAGWHGRRRSSLVSGRARPEPEAVLWYGGGVESEKLF